MLDFARALSYALAMTRSPRWIAAIAGLIIVGLVAGVWWVKGAAQLEVVNPLPRAIVIRVDDRAPQTLAAQSAGGVEAGRSGPHVISVVDEHQEPVETVVASLRGNSRVNVYNVLGLAPVYFEQIVYSKNHTGGAEPRVFCGQRIIDFEDIDYLWAEPPQTMSVSEHSDSVIKNLLGLGKGGIRSCIAYAVGNNLDADMVAYGEFEELKPLERSEVLTRAGQLARAAAMVRDALKASPNDVDLHRTLQHLFLLSGRREELRPEYDARASAVTATADDLYLAARMAPLQERMGQYEAALKRFPRSAWLAWGYGWLLLTEGREADAAAMFEATRHSPESVPLAQLVMGEAWALSRLKRDREALSLFERYAEHAEADSVDLSLALMWRAVAAAAGSKQPLQKVADSAQSWLAAYDAVERGEAPTPVMHEGKKEIEPLTVSRGLAVEALFDPAKALAGVKKASTQAIMWVQPTVRTLLLSEAWRVGDAEAAAKLSHEWSLVLPAPDQMRAFLIDGSEGRLRELVDDMTWSALWFARARWATDGATAAAAMKKARFLDPPGGVASKAMAHWPAPGPTVRPAEAWVWVKK